MTESKLFHSHDFAELRAFFDGVCESPIEKAFAMAFTEHSRVYTCMQKEIPVDFFYKNREYYRDSILLVPQLKVDPYRLDFGVLFTVDGRIQKWAIECDGALWHSRPQDVSKDGSRDKHLHERGWRTLRFGGGMLHHRGVEIADRVHMEIDAFKGGATEETIQDLLDPDQFEEVGEVDEAKWFRRTKPYTRKEQGA